MQIEGSAAIVVGGASGLGEATVRRLHAGGAQVTIADVNAEKGEALASELGLSFAPCDVRAEDQVQAAVEATGIGIFSLFLSGMPILLAVCACYRL